MEWARFCSPDRNCLNSLATSDTATMKSITHSWVDYQWPHWGGIPLKGGEFEALVAFVRDALLDERAKKMKLCPLIPDRVPSGYSST